MQYFLSHRFKQGDCDFNEIQVEQPLGNGNSMVFAINFQNQPAAMKEIVIKNQEQAKRVENEIMIMKSLAKFEYSIIKYYGSFTTIRELDRYNMTQMTYIVMEKAIMSLERLIQHKIRSEEVFNESEIVSLMKVLINTLYILQKQGIAHCDIKPQNILVMNIQTLQVKLCDIGSCRITSSSTQEATLVGTVPFLAPQLIKNYSKQKVTNNPYKSDVFSLGLCFLYLLLFKKFKSNDRLKIGQKVYEQIIMEWVKEAKQLYFKNQVICILLDKLLNFNEKERVNFTQLNDIFNQANLEYVMNLNIINKQAKRKHEQLFLQKVKAPIINNSTLNSMNSINLMNQTNGGVSNNTIISLRSTFYSVKQEPKFGTTSQVLRKTSSFGFKISSVQRTQTSNTRKIRKRIIIPKKSQQSSTPNLSNFNVAVSPLLAKRKKSTHIAAINIHNNIFSATTDDSPKLIPKIVQKSQLPVDIQKHKIVYINSSLLEILRQHQIDWFDKLIIFDGCYNNLYDTKQITIRINNQQNLGNVIRSNKEYQNLMSLVIDLRQFVLNPQTRFEDQIYFRSLKVLCILMDNSLIPNAHDFLQMLIPDDIKKLNLSFKKSQIKPENLYSILQYLSNNAQLQFLNLNLQQVKLTEKQNEQIISIISKFKQIKHMKINFQHNNISYAKEHAWQLPKTLQKLVLEYSYNNLRSILNNFSISLSGIKGTLKDLVLKLEDTALSSKEVNFLFSCLTKLQLENLCLKLGYNHLDDSVAKYVSKNLSLLQTVTTLDVGLENTGISTEGFCSIISAVDKMISRKLRFVTFSYNRYTQNLQITQQLLSLIKSQSKTKILFDNSLFRFYMSMRPNIQIRTTKKVSIRKPMADSFCSRYHPTGQSFKHYLCLTCIQNNPIHKNIFLCQYCRESCDHTHHSIVPTFDNASCGCSFLKCKSDINQPICTKKQGNVIQSQYRCLSCQKNNLCYSCAQSCKKNHKEMVIDNQNLGRFKCCQNKEVKEVI